MNHREKQLIKAALSDLEAILKVDDRTVFDAFAKVRCQANARSAKAKLTKILEGDLQGKGVKGPRSTDE